LSDHDGTRGAVAGGSHVELTRAPAIGGDEPDSVLEEQIAHLDAIERRQEMLYAGREVELAGVPSTETAEPPLPEEAWPEAIPEPPGVEESLGALVAWLNAARAVLAARASRNRDEVQRLSTQWLLAGRNLSRLRSDEVEVLVEALARVRERVAADEVLTHLLRSLAGHLAEWEAIHPAPEAATVPTVSKAPDTVTVAAAPEDPAPSADVDLVRRLLEESTRDRARAARALMESVLEVVCGMALDMEVVQRQVVHHPETAGETLGGLQRRLLDLVDDLRSLPQPEVVTPEPGEPLQATLRRCVDAQQGPMSVDLAWSAAEPAGDEVAAAAAWIVQEFLGSAASGGAGAAGVVLGGGTSGVVLGLTAEAAMGEPEGGVEPGWLLRCRARAAVAGGTVSVAASPQRCALEVRFPAAA
jgi:hypothetical protein